MDNNIRIARELVRIAKSLVAGMSDEEIFKYVIENGKVPPGITVEEFEAAVERIVANDPSAVALLHEIRHADKHAFEAGDGMRTAGIGVNGIKSFATGSNGAKTLALLAALSMAGYANEAMDLSLQAKCFPGMYNPQRMMYKDIPSSSGLKDRFKDKIYFINDTRKPEPPKPASDPVQEQKGAMDSRNAMEFTKQTVGGLMGSKSFEACKVAEKDGVTIICSAVKVPAAGAARNVSRPTEGEFRMAESGAEQACDRQMDQAIEQIASKNGLDADDIRDRMAVRIHGTVDSDCKPRTTGNFDACVVYTVIIYGLHGGSSMPSGSPGYARGF